MKFKPCKGRKYCHRHRGLNTEKMRSESKRIAKGKRHCAVCNEPLEENEDKLCKLCEHEMV